MKPSRKRRRPIIETSAFVSDATKLLVWITLLLAPILSDGQLTTGLLEGLVRDLDGHAASQVPIHIEGGAGFELSIHTDSAGRFALPLPYGRYLLSGRSSFHANSVPLRVAPLQTTSVDLVTEPSGELRDLHRRQIPSPGLWSDVSHALIFPEGFSLHSALASRDPGAVTVPLDFTGLRDSSLALVSERAFSWTGTQFRWQGLDATDSYQPGRLVILPDVQATSELVVRTGSALLDSRAFGGEVNVFLAEPGRSWHTGISTAGMGSVFSSDNLLSPSGRGAIQQTERFDWFTRDRLEVGGPVTSSADVFASEAGEWASQTVGLDAPGQSQNSRLLLTNLRGRIRASTRDQFDAEYSGSRVNLSNGATPAGIEALVSRRMSPDFNLPGGFREEAEADSFGLLQAGWTHQYAAGAARGALQLRYGHSAARFNTWPSRQSLPDQSRIELLGSTVAGAPPLATLATRPRDEVATGWQSARRSAGKIRQQIAIGGTWEVSSPGNRFATPSNLNLITVDGAPAYVVNYNTPVHSRERVRELSAYVADHLPLSGGFSVDAGISVDFPRGSLPAQTAAAQSNMQVARGIAWNSVSPRLGFSWQIPHAHGFVVGGAYLRSYTPLAARYLDYTNPSSLGGTVSQWLDRNGDGWFQSGEAGALLTRFGGAYSSISRSLRRPYADEFDVSGSLRLSRRSWVGIQLFRRDEKDRIAAVDWGLGPEAFIPVSILDPGPDGTPGTFDDQRIIAYQQSPATFGKDQYLLTNAPGLRTLNAGFVAQVGIEWGALTMHASFTAEKGWGPTNQGNAAFQNDPGVVGTLLADSNSGIFTVSRSFVDRAYLGKMQATYRLPSAWAGLELASIADYMDGLPFARDILVRGLAQGPFLLPATVRGSPEGGNRAQYVLNWNLRVQRAFRLHIGTMTACADILNVTNGNQKVQESDLSGPAFNSRLPIALQSARFVRLTLAYRF